jgi:hypothetical protein
MLIHGLSLSTAATGKLHTQLAKNRDYTQNPPRKGEAKAQACDNA